MTQLTGSRLAGSYIESFESGDVLAIAFIDMYVLCRLCIGKNAKS